MAYKYVFSSRSKVLQEFFIGGIYFTSRRFLVLKHAMWNVLECAASNRGVVLEDVLGLEDIFENNFWSPWPRPRSLKSSKIVLSSARGQLYFWTVEISLENARNLAENLQRPFFLVSSSRDGLKKNFWRPFFLRSPERISEDLFFFENTCVYVLGPWPWPREGLSFALASKFFCVHGLGLEPCVLDSTSGFKRKSKFSRFKLWFL